MTEPRKNPNDTIFTSEDCLVVVFEGPGDNTHRPRRPNNPRDWPPQEWQPPADPPPLPPDSAGK